MRATVAIALLGSGCMAVISEAPRQLADEPIDAPALHHVPELEAEPDDPETDAEPIAADAEQGLGQDDVLLQLEFEPTFGGSIAADPFRAYGRVPVVSLYADGTVIHVGQNGWRDGVWIAAIGADEARRLHEQALAAGAAELRGYENWCRDSKTVRTCIADASFAVLGVRRRNGRLVATKHYAGWAPAHQRAFDEVIAILDELRGRDSDERVAYRPHAATLFVAPWTHDDLTPAAEWPLAPALIDDLTPQDDPRVLVVAGDDLEAVADGLAGYAGRRAFQHHGRYYAAELVPWLPGVDFTKAIRRRSR